MVDGHELVVSNLDKVLYPAAGFTKAHVIDYYTRVADVMIPHLAGRPLTMIRYPDGVDGGRFFEKRCPTYAPDWVARARLGRDGREKVVEHCQVANRATLVWIANLASIEVHTVMGREPDTSSPTMVVFDLDPGAPADIVDCCWVALELRTVLDRLGLMGLPKTSGGKGLQVYVPVNRPSTYDETKGFALAVGQVLERVHRDRVTTNMNKDVRPGKVFVDWSQNTLTKTTVSPYSLRARERPTVSTPLTWDEVAETAEDGRPERLRFEAADVLERVERHGDLFATTLELEQELPTLG